MITRYLQRRVDWWTDSPAWLFELLLLLTAIGWCLVIAFSPAAVGGQAVIAMRDIAPLWVWAAITGSWAILYTVAILLHSPKWRCVWLIFITGWWSLVTVTFTLANGYTTGTAVYLSYTICSFIAAAHSAERAARRP